MKIILVSKCSLGIEQYVEFKMSILISPSKGLISLNQNFILLLCMLLLCLLTLLYLNAGFRLTCRLPHCRYAAWSSLAVSELQLSAAMPLWLYHRAASLPSWIEFNCLRSAVVGKAARLSIYWLDAACCLVIPLQQVALAQLNKYHHQSGNAASG